MIYGAHGRVRSGKTLFLTAYLFSNYLYGRKIMSNYNLYFPTKEELIVNGMAKLLMKYYKYDITMTTLHKPESLDLDLIIKNMLDGNSELENTTVGIDEVYLFADARLSMQQKNVFFSYLLLQSGKHNNDIMVTSQQLRLEDVRIEDNSNYEIFCSRIPYDHHQPLEGVRIMIQDNYSREILKDFVWNDFGMYFNMYDTKQIVKINQTKKSDDVLEQSIKQLVRDVRLGI